MIKDHEPTKMVATKLYSTFQLCCSIFPVNDDNTVHDVFNKTILYIIAWFRKRAGNDTETLEKLSPYPAPVEFGNFDVAILPDIKIREAFNVNTLFLQEKANWSLRISEPDNHAEFKGEKPESKIEGRSFITNIAVHEGEKCVTLSYKCECKEPKTNDQDCKTFRPRFLKDLCRDDSFLLKELPDTDSSYDRICEECISIEGNAVAKNLAINLIQNDRRQLPVLLFSGDSLDESILSDTAGRLVGFCHVFMVSGQQFNRLFKSKLQNDDIRPGDIVLYKKGTDYEVIETKDDENMTDVIVSLVENYPVRKNINYRNTLFYREAKTAKFEVINTNDPTELLVKVNQQKEIIEEKERKLDEQAADTEALQEELWECNRKLKRAEDAYKLLQDKYTSSVEKQKELTGKIDSYNRNVIIYKKLLQLVLRFPTRKEDVPKWVQENFSGELLFHERAEKSLRRYDKQLNIKLLCSAILYLDAYLLFKREEISELELELYKLEKPWEIVLCGKENVANYSEYKIDLSQYYVKEKVDYLNFHLKSGNKADNLLRVYFSINEELNKIVIGYLPDHLPIKSRTH